MNILELIEYLHNNDIKISITVDNNLRLEYNGELSRDIIDKLRFYKEDLIKFFKKSALMPIPKLSNQKNYDLSDNQRRIWILSKLYEGGSAAYNMFGTTSIFGDQNIDLLKKAIFETIERHEILRTVFYEDENGTPKQWIKNKAEIKYIIEHIDLKKTASNIDFSNKIISEDRYKIFNFKNGPLIRIYLFEMSDEHIVFYYNVHHIICDGWSLGVLCNDILHYYDAFRKYEEPDLTPLRFQYKDYSKFQLDKLKSDKNQKMERYWLKKFETNPPSFDLPSSKNRPAIKTFNGFRMEFNFTKNFTDELKEFCKINHGTLFTGILASIYALLYRYTSNEDIVIGSPVIGRNYQELENQVGFYVNTLVFRQNISKDDSFLTLFGKVNNEVLESHNNSDYPFIRLVDNLKIKRDSSRNPLVNILVVLQNAVGGSNSIMISEGDVDRVIEVGKVLCRLDIDFSFEVIGDNLNMFVEFNTDLYEKEAIQRLILNYKKLLTKLLQNPQRPIKLIDYITDEEKNKLLAISQGEITDYCSDKSVIDRFSDICRLAPTKEALIDESKVFTYKELNDISNQFTRFLKQTTQLGVNGYVIIQLEKSSWHVIAQLAILKSKNAFIPIDISFPREKKNQIIKNSNCEIIINKQMIADFVSKQSCFQPDDSNFDINPNDLAYVIYTSGTTGNPKGVKISHKNINRLVINNGYCNFTSSTITLSTAAFSFDAAIFEIYGTLLNGGKVVIQKQVNLLDTHKLNIFVKEYKINTIWLTSGWLNQLVDIQSNVFGNLDYLICGGEALSGSRINTLKKKYPHLTIVNGYGPTENCTFSLTCICNQTQFDSNVPIGQPISNSSVYVLDDEGSLVPKGVVGELFLGGKGLSEGYLNNDPLTLQKFIENPFQKNEKLYRSGDLGRIREDDLIEFVSRKDSQIKIRGFRVEPQEIEEALRLHENVTGVVINFTGEPVKLLIAFVTMNPPIENVKLKSFLKDKLPIYMIPDEIVVVAEFPLNINGKIDQSSLMSHFQNGSKLNEIIQPVNLLEEIIVGIWKDTLKLNEISVKSYFYDLGGNSIRLIDLSAKMSQYFDITYNTLGMYLDNHSIEELAQKLPLKKEVF